MNDNKILWFLIYLVIICAIVWGIGAFITFNLTWFYDTLLGRLIAMIFFIIAIRASMIDEFHGE